MKKRKKNKFKSYRLDRSTVIRCGIICAAILVVYLIGSLFFRNHFYIRSKVNGVGASFLGAESTYNKICSISKEQRILDVKLYYIYMS